MHICLATCEYLPQSGGIATYYGNLAQLLVEAGYRVTVLTADAESRQGEQGNPAVVSLDAEVSRQLARLQPRLSGQRRTVLNNLALGMAMREWLAAHAERLAFDVVEVAEYGGYGAFLLGEHLPPLTVTCHGSFGQIGHHQTGASFRSAEFRLLVGLEALALSMADGVAAYSPMNVTEWGEYLGRTVRFVVAPWRLGGGQTTPRLATSANEAVIGITVGRLQDWKGCLEAADAMRICQARVAALRWQWVGNDTASAPEGGSMAEYLAREYADVWSTGLAWVGALPREQARAAQVAADFAVVPSRWDTFNFTALEAMAAATPVILSTRAGASYLVQHCENGLLVPPRDPAALADALAEMAGDANLRRRLGEAGYATVQAEFAPERVVRSHLDGYEEAIRRRAQRKANPYLAGAADAILAHMGLDAQNSRLPLLGDLGAPQRALRSGTRRLRRLWSFSGG